LLDCETWPSLGFAGLPTQPSYDFSGLPIGPSLDLLDCQLDQALGCWIANWASVLLDCQLDFIFAGLRNLDSPGFAGLPNRPSYAFTGLPIAPGLDLLDRQLGQTLVCWIAN
jgi:hypothetical protein